MTDEVVPQFANIISRIDRLQGMVDMLKEFKNLTTLDLKLSSPGRGQICNDNDLQSSIARLKRVLKASPAKQKKYLRLLTCKRALDGGFANYENIALD